MNHSELEVSQWLDGLKVDDSLAQQMIWERIFDRVVRIARRRLESNGLERRTRDEEDIAMSAINSLFRQASSGELSQLEDSTQLWKLLATFTKFKVSKKRKFDQAGKRGGQHVRTLDELGFGDPEEGLGIGQIVGAEPKPEFIVAMDDAVQSLPEDIQMVVVARLEGKDNREIASSMNISARTVQRMLNRVEEYWSID